MDTLAQIDPGATLEDELRRFCATAEAHTAIVPERQLAKRYGITHAAVRRVLETLMHDQLIYREHGRGTYVAERRAAELKTLLIVDSWNRLGHPYFAGRLRGITDAAKELGFTVEVFDAPPMDTPAFFDRVARDEVQGVLVPWISQSLVQRLRRLRPQLAIMSSGRILYDSTVAHVVVDYAALGAMAADYLVGQGATRPLLLCSQQYSGDGFLAQCQAAGVAGRVLPVRDALAQRQDALLAEYQALAPDGLASDDEHVTRALWQAGVRPSIPVITQATRGADLIGAQIARLDVDPRAMGRMIVRTLHDMIAHDTYRQCTIMSRPTLVEPRP